MYVRQQRGRGHMADDLTALRAGDLGVLHRDDPLDRDVGDRVEGRLHQLDLAVDGPNEPRRLVAMAVDEGRVAVEADAVGGRADLEVEVDLVLLERRPLRTELTADLGEAEAHALDRGAP